MTTCARVRKMKSHWTVLAVLLFATSATADRLHLRNGDYVDVDGWRAEGDHILYERFGGTIGIHKTEVLRIEQKATDPTSWQAPGSSRNPSQPSSTEVPTTAPSPAATSGVASAERWTPEPAPTPPTPPARDASKANLASYWERQKHFAMQRMDDYANAKGTCAARYRTKIGIQVCEDGRQQSYRFWNERYIVASREYEKHR